MQLPLSAFLIARDLSCLPVVVRVIPSSIGYLSEILPVGVLQLRQ